MCIYADNTKVGCLSDQFSAPITFDLLAELQTIENAPTGTTFRFERIGAWGAEFVDLSLTYVEGM